MAAKRSQTTLDRSDAPPAKAPRRLGLKAPPEVTSSQPADTTGAANVQMEVFVRVRPLNERELATGSKKILRVDTETALVFDPTEDSEPFFFRGTAQKTRDLNKRVNKNMLFEFNRVFDENSTNEEVFEQTTKKVVAPVLEGYNSSVFAYGATGAGKTYTMLGTSDNPGIAYRTIVELLNQVEQLDGWRVTLGASYLEVHNENVKDLIHPASGKLQLREEGGQVLVSGLKVETIRSADQLFSLLAKGNAKRTQYATETNAESSRSHAVFQVHVRMEHVMNQLKLSKLSMIDLAGSERGSVTGYEGEHFKEGSNINKSLLALGNCINALAGGQKHVPYRDSNLTRILKDSLGGNCRTMMIANISPASVAFETTYKTLNYATRARSIKSQVSQNLRAGTKSVAQYQQLVDELQKKLRQAESQAKGVDLTGLQEWEQKIADVMEQKKVLHQRILKLQSEERLTAWRLKHKISMVDAQDSIDEVTSIRYKRGIDQLTLRLETFQNQIVQSKPMLLSVYERETALVQEIDSVPNLAPYLRHILEKYRYMVENVEHSMCEEHMQKINQLQAKQVERHSNVVSSLVSLSSDLYRLLQASGHLTGKYESEYQTALRDVDGLKAVSFADDEYRALTENNKLLRLSLGVVHDKPDVTDEAMQRYQDTLPLKDLPMNNIKPIPFRSLPSLWQPKATQRATLDKENSFTARTLPSAGRVPGARNTPDRNRDGLRAIRNKMHTERVHPYQNTRAVKTKSRQATPSAKQPAPCNPVRMNKIVAARMPNATR